MREIVVGVDSSLASERALDRALREAETTHRPLQVLHAWGTPVWMGGIPGFGYNVLASPIDSERLAGELVEEFIAKGLSRRSFDLPISLRSHVKQGEAGRVLVDAAGDAALVVVGGRGHGYVKSALLGSVSAYVLHHAVCPVMIVPERGPSSGAGVERVVVGVDGSPSSRSALMWGLAAARREGCPLIVLHAWLMTTLPGRPPMQFVPPLSEYENEARQWLEQEITTVVPDPQGVEIRAELSHGGAPWALLEQAGTDDLLVLGSRGHGGFASLVVGSVATQCAMHARGVTVVVRAGQERLDP